VRRNSIIPLVFVCSLPFGAVASAQPLPVVIPQTSDPLLQNLTIPADAHLKGMWSASYPWDLIAMHSAVMPDGRVVTFGSPVGVDTIKAEIFDIWSPSLGFTVAAHRKLANISSVDSFCAASVLLKTGELLTSGGNKGIFEVPQDFTLNKGTSLVHANGNSAAAGSQMASPRYYATQTVLPDARVLITGGTFAGGPATFSYQLPQNHVNQVSGTPEVYTPEVGWSSLFGATSLSPTGGDDAFGPQDNRWWYPRQWVAPNGTVFGLSTHRMWYLDPNANGGLGSINLFGTFKSGVGSAAKPNVGATSTAAMFDVGKILQVGGNGRLNATLTADWTDSSPYATVIDITNAPNPPVITEMAEMPGGGRQWANATVLPNGHVLVTGGTRIGNSSQPLDVATQAVIWNPTGTWTAGASASVGRVYHSTALLLPNGTVLTAGSGGPPGWPQASPGRFNAEVYYPPYLFQQSGGGSTLASRPKILSMNGRKFSHGSTILAEISPGHTISKAVLIGLGSATHSFDMGQRLYPALFKPDGTRISLTAPGPNLVPPGYYYLFVTNQSGVPSEGVILAIGFDLAPPPTESYTRLHGTKFDVDGDGKADMAVWRPDETVPRWWIIPSTSGNGYPHPWGGIVDGVQDIPVPGDYDGDGKTDLAVWRPRAGHSDWWILPTGGQKDYTVAWGGFFNGVRDIPVPGDYDGDGKTDVAFWRPRPVAEWHIKRSSDNQTYMVPFGAVNNGVVDIPVPADYDGDGKTDLAVWRPGTGMSLDCEAADSKSCWWIMRSNPSNPGWTIFPWGGIINGVADIPVPGDYDGDGKADMAVFRPQVGQDVVNWYVVKSTGGVIQESFGGTVNGTQDVPVPADYDGDGKVDLAIWRPRRAPDHSQWWIAPSGGVGIPVTNWGGVFKGVSDLPITARY
jgi:hypothetical protein